MAESKADVILITDDDDDCVEVHSEKIEKDHTEKMECPICLQPCIHPARLPCGHIFCFLCVKGVAHKNRRCAMCRREIPPEFLDHPQLVHGIEELCKSTTTEDGFQWFYEGRNGGWWAYDCRTSSEIEDAFIRKAKIIDILICGNLYIIEFGKHIQYPKEFPSRTRLIKREKKNVVNIKGVAGWWQYDERTSQDIEDAYKKGEKSCKILVAGFVYVVDFEAMLQQRQNDPSRRRHVKRDLASIPKKGVAGLRIDGNSVTADLDSLHFGDQPTRLRQNSSNFISTITDAATDAAIRIASNIIESTLAHADEVHSSEDRGQSRLPSHSHAHTRERIEEAAELSDSTEAANIVPLPDDEFDLITDNLRLLALQNIVDPNDTENDSEPIIL